MQKLFTRNLVGPLTLLVLSAPSLACAALTPVEVVQSVPEETSLAVPGLRQAKDVWPEMIAEAKSTIDICQMYMSSEKDRAMEPVLQALEEAGNRGVKIRYILWVGMKDNDQATLDRVRAIPNLSFAFYDLKKITGGINHSKYWILDGKRIYVGSQNFDWRSLQEIHETGVLVDNEALAARLKGVFDHDWKFATTGKFDETDTVPATPRAPADVEVVSSPERLNPKGIDSGIKKLLSLIAGAKETVQIALLDYSTSVYGGKTPWTEIDDALRAAAKRGVKVQVAVSSWNTAKDEVGSIKSLTQVPNIQVRVAFIPEASSGHIAYARVIHTKHMIVDGKTYWVGTSNWSKGYFYDTRDIEVIMNRPDLAATGTKIFNAVWTAPYTEAVDPAKNYPEPKKD